MAKQVTLKHVETNEDFFPLTYTKNIIDFKDTNAKSFESEQDIIDFINDGNKLYKHQTVYIGNNQYQLYDDCFEIEEGYVNVFEAVPLYPSFGGFFRVDEEGDLIPFVKGVHARVKKIGDPKVNLEQYLVFEDRIPRAMVYNYENAYLLHGYLTASSLAGDGQHGFLYWYWDIDIWNETAYCKYVDVTSYVIRSVVGFQGTSPNLYKFYAEYSDKIKTLLSKEDAGKLYLVKDEIEELIRKYTDELNVSNGADWGAQEGEDGFIKNKPFYKENDDRLMYSGEHQTESNSYWGEIELNDINMSYGDEVLESQESTIRPINRLGDDVLYPFTPDKIRLVIENIDNDNRVFFDGILTGGLPQANGVGRTYQVVNAIRIELDISVNINPTDNRATITYSTMIAETPAFDNDRILIKLYAHTDTVKQIDDEFIPIDSIVSACRNELKIFEFAGMIEKPHTSLLDIIPFYNPTLKSFGTYVHNNFEEDPVWSIWYDYMTGKLIVGSHGLTFKPRTDVIFKCDNELWRFDEDLDELVKFIDEGDYLTVDEAEDLFHEIYQQNNQTLLPTPPGGILG